jgi:hypothetical protein
MIFLTVVFILFPSGKSYLLVSSCSFIHCQYCFKTVFASILILEIPGLMEEKETHFIININNNIKRPLAAIPFFVFPYAITSNIGPDLFGKDDLQIDSISHFLLLTTTRAFSFGETVYTLGLLCIWLAPSLGDGRLSKTRWLNLLGIGKRHYLYI